MDASRASVQPSAMAKPYRVRAVGKSGEPRELTDCTSLLVEVRPGVELEIDLQPHGNFRGELILLVPPASDMERLYAAGTVDRFAITAGAANVLHVHVERHVRKRPAPRRRRPAPARMRGAR